MILVLSIFNKHCLENFNTNTNKPLRQIYNYHKKCFDVLWFVAKNAVIEENQKFKRTPILYWISTCLQDHKPTKMEDRV